MFKAPPGLGGAIPGLSAPTPHAVPAAASTAGPTAAAAAAQPVPPPPPPAQQKAVVKRTIDYTAPFLQLIAARLHGFNPSRSDLAPASMPLPVFADTYTLLPPIGYLNQPAVNFPLKLVASHTGKVKSSINCVMWAPDGRRCMTGSTSGDLSIWDGRTGTSESVLQGHEAPVRSMQYTHSENLIISSDDKGQVKLWSGRKDNFLDPMLSIPAHREPCRSVTVAPTDRKFASASDDSTIKVYDIVQGTVENTLLGHGGDVRWVEWHPREGLLASGSKDALVKLWDPRGKGVAVATLHGHKNGLSAVRWNPHNGHWLLTGARDSTLKVFDIRRLRDLATYVHHARDVMSCCWHPQQEEMFASGSADCGMALWLVPRQEPQAVLPQAHDRDVLCLAWHPLGHLMTSGGGDHFCRFWCRARPGDLFKDIRDEGGTTQAAAMAGAAGLEGSTAAGAVPGLGAAGGVPASSLSNLGIAAKIPGLGDIINKISQQEALTGRGAAAAPRPMVRERVGPPLRETDRERDRDQRTRDRPDPRDREWDRDRDRRGDRERERTPPLSGGPSRAGPPVYGAGPPQYPSYGGPQGRFPGPEPREWPGYDERPPPFGYEHEGWSRPMRPARPEYSDRSGGWAHGPPAHGPRGAGHPALRSGPRPAARGAPRDIGEPNEGPPVPSRPPPTTAHEGPPGAVVLPQRTGPPPPGGRWPGSTRGRGRGRGRSEGPSS